MFNIISAEKLEKRAAAYLLYGSPGVGKTSTLKFLPGKTLIIDIDKTSGVLKGEKNIDVMDVDVNTLWEDWDKIFNTAISGDYKNIVVDNLTEALKVLAFNMGLSRNNDGIPEIRDYQKIFLKILDTVRKVRDNKKTLILTAWEKEKQHTDADSGASYSIVSPDVSDGLSNSILGLCDVVGRLVNKKVGNDLKRGFILQAKRSVVAKNQIDDRAWCLQDELFTQGLPKGNN